MLAAPKAKADAIAARAPGFIGIIPGRTIISAPANPITQDNQPLNPTNSPSKSPANKIVNKGTVKSRAWTLAISSTEYA